MKRLIVLIALLFATNAFAEDVIKNNHTIEHWDNGQKKYIEKGSGIAYQDGATWKRSKRELKPSAVQDEFEQNEGVAKVKIGKNLQGKWDIHYTLDGVIYKSNVLGVGYCDAQGNYTLFDTPDNTKAVNENGIVKFNSLKYGRIEYQKEYGEFTQRLVIPDKTKLPDAQGKEYICLVTEFDTMLPGIEGAHNVYGKIYEVTSKVIGKKLIEMIKLSDITTDDIVINYTTKSGSATGNETWTTGTYLVQGYEMGNYTLDVSAGVVIKADQTAVYALRNTGGKITFNGTSANPVYFTSNNDDTVGEVIAGSSGSPAKGDWDDILINGTGGLEMNYTVIRYGAGDASVPGAIMGNNSGATITLNNCTFSENRYNHAINYSNNATWVMNSCIFLKTYTNYSFQNNTGNPTVTLTHCTFWQTSAFYDIAPRGTGTWTIKNCQFKYITPSEAAIYCIGNATVNISYTSITGGYSYASIMSNTAVGETLNLTTYNNIVCNGVYGFRKLTDNGTTNWTSDFNNCWNNSTSNFGTVAKGGDDLETNPQWTSSGTDTYDGLFLTQATSPCVNSGSEIAAAAGLDSSYGTDPAHGVFDSGTADRGYHYFYELSPVAAFSGTPTTIERGDTVTFTDASTNSPTSWDWDFGDGTAHGTDQNPTHIYYKAGTYTVTLTATNGAGSDDEVKVDYITVTDFMGFYPVSGSYVKLRDGGTMEMSGVTADPTLHAGSTGCLFWYRSDTGELCVTTPDGTYRIVVTER